MGLSPCGLFALPVSPPQLREITGLCSGVFSLSLCRYLETFSRQCPSLPMSNVLGPLFYILSDVLVFGGGRVNLIPITLFLPELTRQISPPTKNGHALPPMESRRAIALVSPVCVWACELHLNWVK